jgi:outer membrane receptor protein involved in Fe transport
VRPEYVRTIEFGYRTTLGKKLYFDISFYRSWYQYFIGYKIGAKVDWPVGTPFANKYTFYRVATNSKDEVVTMGYTAGINYFFKKQLGFDFNYSFNELDRKGSTDPLIPAFNTPRHKYNFGISGRDFIINFFGKRFDHWSYSINYKYVDGFLFEGSPQFTGFVPAYDMVDVQVSKSIPKTYCTLKLGANNVLNNKVIQVYGGPQVGRLVYFSILFDWSARR